MRKIGCFVICLIFVIALSGLASAEESLYVKKVDNLPSDFILGMDISSVLAEEASGVVYRNQAGEPQDIFQTLAEAGVNTIRVRIWNNPYDEEGNSFGGGNCDLANAIAIGQRATAHGMRLMVDFHYSDFWADPGKQQSPRAWEGMEIHEKAQALYDFTANCLAEFQNNGVKVCMVQIGNETNGGLAGETDWENIQLLFQAGASATRNTLPEALVAVHFANPENNDNYLDIASILADYEVDYDVFATSYYPYWHGTLENLSSVLSIIAEKYDKKVLVAETSYAYTAEDTDFFANTIGEESVVTKNYPYTVQGQANCFRDIADTIANDTTNGIGVLYWEGAWISVGGSTYEENFARWEKYGSGWASSYAKTYDPKDAGKYFGGSAVDNQAFFDADGVPLASLDVFRLMADGNECALTVDAIEDVHLVCDLNGNIVLPTAVNAIMTDNSRQSIPVEWHVTEDDDEKWHQGGVAKYTILGTAGGMDVKLYLSMEEFNYLQNSSFEDGEIGWVATNLGGADQLYAEEKVTDSLTGVWHYHFWSAKENSVDFTLEQQVTDLPVGHYRYAISIMGGDAGSQTIYAYVMQNGEMIAQAPMQITSYGNWCEGVIDDFAYDGESELIVGISVQCAGSGNGAWGKIDDARLTLVAR